MAMSVVATTTMTLDTTEPSVPVTARWAPMTSLFMPLISAPVWVRVKKAMGMRCTWSNRATRRSKMRPSPIRRTTALEAWRQGLAEGHQHHQARQHGDRPPVLVGQGVVDDPAG